MLDKNIFNIISKFRKSLPKSKIEITTNGDVLNISRIKKLFISGLTSFYISVYDGPEDEKKFIKMCKEAGLREHQYKIRARYLPEEKDFGITLSNGGQWRLRNIIPSLEKSMDKPCCYQAIIFLWIIMAMFSSVHMIGEKN